MSKIFELIQEDHFGNTYTSAMRDIEKGESILLSGMPGAGVKYLFKFLQKNLESKYSKATFLNFSGLLISTNTVDSISESILKITKKDDLLKSVKFFNDKQKLFIFIENFQDIDVVDSVLEFITTLRSFNTHSIIFVAAIDFKLFSAHRESFQKYHSAFSTSYFLRPFDLEGSKRNIKLNNDYYGWDIPITLAEKIHNLSGGNSRLVKYICKILFLDRVKKLDDINFISTHSLVSPKLDEMIRLLLTLDKVDLKTLGILNEHDEIFSDLVKFRLENQSIVNLEKEFPNLSHRELKVLNYLLANKNKIVSAEKLEYFFDLIGEDYSLWASYKAISRLKQKIKHRYELRNVKGKGYVLETEQ